MKSFGVVIFIFCVVVIYHIFDSEKEGLSMSAADNSHGGQLNRRRRQTPGEDYRYTLEILFVVDPAVVSWFKSQSSPGTEDQVLREATNRAKLHYLRIFNGIKERFTTSTELNLDVVLVDMVIAENISFPSPLAFTHNPRSLIPAPEVLDTFRNWVNTTELPNNDHALLFTGYNLTYGGSASSTGLSYPDSVCTELAMSVVEDFYDERTAIFAAQELGRSLGSRLDMDGNFCRATNLNIMSTKFVFNSPKTPNLWKFSRCSISYIQNFLKKSDSAGTDCLRSRTAADVPLSQATNAPDADTQCRTAFGLESFLCRALTGPDYSALCGGMSCYSPGSTTCSSILPLDGTICGNFTTCNGGECVLSNDGKNVPDRCPFGDQPVVPGSVGCADRVYGRPYDCYLPSVNAACCASCEEIKTDITGCEYGDRTERCQFSKCPTYNNFTRENLCCLTCINGKLPYSGSTVPLLTSTSSESVFNVTDDANTAENGTSLIKTTTPPQISSSLPILSTADSTQVGQNSTITEIQTTRVSTTAPDISSVFSKTARSSSASVTKETVSSYTTRTENLASTSETSVTSSDVTLSSASTAKDISSSTPTTGLKTSETAAISSTLFTTFSNIASSEATESTTPRTTSDVTSARTTTSSSSAESSSSEDSREKKRKKEWKKKQKQIEKERKRNEKRIKALKKKYDKMMKKLRKYLELPFFRNFL